MKIVSLTAENVLRLRAVQITPKGNMVEITGRNEQGKSSVLNAIWLALDQTKVDAIQPIRKGANKAFVRLDLGEIVVERKFTEKTSTLTITGADGSKFGSPQKMLDPLLGLLSFDPLEFARMKPREQFDMLRKVVKIDLDFDKLDGLNRADFDRRAELNRQAKAKRAQAEAIAIPEVLPEQPVDEKAILDRMQSAAEQNAALSARKAKRQAVADKVRGLRETIAQNIEKIAQLQAQVAADTLEADTEQARLDSAAPLPDPIDVSKERAALENAQKLNAALQLANSRVTIAAEADAIAAQAEALTTAMHEREQAKAKAIAEAKMPVDGLGFGDGMVLINGIPLSQGSSAQLIKLSLLIAMAANPKLRVIRIQDGSLLDEDSMELVAKMAEERDYQVWIERVDMSGKLGVVIEDGQVVSAA